MKPSQVLGKLLKVASQAPEGAVPKGLPITKGMPPQTPERSVAQVPTKTSPAMSTYLGSGQPLVAKGIMPANAGKSLWNRPLMAYGAIDTQLKSLAGEEAPTPLRLSGIAREMLNRDYGVVYPAPLARASVSRPSLADKLLGKAGWSENAITMLPSNRMVALHEATHAVDPSVINHDVVRSEDAEVPAMTTEMVEAIRQGHNPQPNLWVEQMKKHGPKLTGNDKQDVTNVESWMKDLRGDTQLGRRYKDWLAQYGNGAAPLPRE